MHELSHRISLTILTLLAAAELGPRAEASCNTFPEATQVGMSPDAIFVGDDGKLDRPFASPEDRLRVESPKMLNASNARVFVFIPGSGSSNVNATVAAITDSLNSCATAESEIDGCFSTATVDRACFVQNNLAIGNQAVEFDFPDTGALVLPTGIAGPATCGLFTAANDCPTAVSDPNVLACVDKLFVETASGVRVRNPVYPSFTALPSPNSFLDVCSKIDGSPSAICRGVSGKKIEFAIDDDGTMLIPMSWAGLWPGYGGPEYPRRLVRGSTAIKARPGNVAPVAVPGPEYLKSLDTFGRSYATPPLYREQTLPTRGNEFTMVGTADKERSVLRVARKMPATHVCFRGSNHDQACLEVTAAEDCPGGLCRELGTFACENDGESCDPNALSPCPSGSGSCVCVGGHVCHGGGDSGMPCNPNDPTPCSGSGSCLCTPEVSNGFFQCSNAGPANGQPCLRQKHCPTTGPFAPQCKRASCNAGVRTCRFDEDCPSPGSGADKSCGHPLYDVRDRRPSTRQPARIPDTPGANEAGICASPGTNSDGQTCSASGPPCPNAAPCVLFRAEVGFIIP
jgi:hypothetical protein